MPAPLADYRVLDFTRLLPGPHATRTLADLGAEVIKIERPPKGDYARSLPPFQGDSSYLFNQLNRNKQSLAVDYAMPQGREVILKLVRTADVVVESFRSGVMAKLGLDYDTLKAEHPDLIYCSLTGYGSTGDWASLAAHDLNIVALSGILEQSGAAGAAPQLSNYQIADMNASMALVSATLAALLGKERFGEGQHLEVSMLQAAMTPAAVILGASNAYGQPLPRGRDALSGGLATYNVYPTSDDRHVALAALEYKFWERFCTAIDRDDLKPKHMSMGQDAQRLKAELIGIFRTRSMADWAELGASANCCLTPVLKMHEAVQHPQVQALQLAQAIETEAVSAQQFAAPIALHTPKNRSFQPAPKLGAHTGELLAHLDYTPEQLAQLAEQSIIQF